MDGVYKSFDGKKYTDEQAARKANEQVAGEVKEPTIGAPSEQAERKAKELLPKKKNNQTDSDGEADAMPAPAPSMTASGAKALEEKKESSSESSESGETDFMEEMKEKNEEQAETIAQINRTEVHRKRIEKAEEEQGKMGSPLLEQEGKGGKQPGE